MARMPAMTEAWKLFLLLMSTGFMIMVIHDYAYRRADVTGTGDYELGGLVSHAGTDILITTFIMSVVAVLWSKRRIGAHRAT